jgi:hypothetical protein
MTETTVIAPVVRTVNVSCPVDDAFRIFTREISTWWPTSSHAVHPGAVREIVWEEHEGGEIYEVSTAGERAHWATLTKWEPPTRLVIAWFVNPEMPAPTEVEVRFTAEGVELEHRYWERLGDFAAEKRARYQGGWDTVLQHLVDAVAER